MTQAEFYRAQREAREQYLKIFRKVDREISQLYKSAADEVADKLRTLTLTGKGDSLTAGSLRSLESTLRKTGARIAGETEKIIIRSIDDGITATSGPSKKFLKDAIEISGIKKIKFDIIDKMYSQINEDMINLTYTRIWDDGYTFSDKIWGFPGTEIQPYLPGLAQYWQDDVKNMITFGFAQGRDILQVAKDLSYYAVHGKPGLMKRYGQLVRGTKQFAKRFPKWIDWRAMRLARSELYISLQESAKFQGKFNPAVLEYIWNLTAGAAHECICPDLAADSPYAELTIPDFPHPNCLCYITHKIMSRDEFVQDLVDWGQGIGVPNLDNWYVNYYLPYLN
jgi:hypothetical protein